MSRSNKELASQLAQVGLFSRCSERDLRAVARHVEAAEYADGTSIVVQDEVSDAFYLVLDGELTVVTDGSPVATLGPGDHFGELGLLDPAPRSASVVAGTDVSLGVLSLRMFRVLLRDMPEIAFAMFEALAGMLREARGS